MLVFAICACVVAGVLRQYSPGFAIVFSLGCACLLLCGAWRWHSRCSIFKSAEQPAERRCTGMRVEGCRNSRFDTGCAGRMPGGGPCGTGGKSRNAGAPGRAGGGAAACTPVCRPGRRAAGLKRRFCKLLACLGLLACLLAVPALAEEGKAQCRKGKFPPSGSRLWKRHP